MQVLVTQYVILILQSFSLVIMPSFLLRVQVLLLQIMWTTLHLLKAQKTYYPMPADSNHLRNSFNSLEKLNIKVKQIMHF